MYKKCNKGYMALLKIADFLHSFQAVAYAICHFYRTIELLLFVLLSITIKSYK
uniref:Uncharacterized protein n=1 Tax=Anguilla anguilla TaxID=7936 RepID=A0A0E9QLX2_ANGAN